MSEAQRIKCPATDSGCGTCSTIVNIYSSHKYDTTDLIVPEVFVMERLSCGISGKF